MKRQRTEEYPVYSFRLAKETHNELKEMREEADLSWNKLFKLLSYKYGNKHKKNGSRDTSSQE